MRLTAQVPLTDQGFNFLGTEMPRILLSAMRFISIVVLLALAAVSADAASSGRTLVPADMIQIRVVGQPDFDLQVRIENDGTIAYPYIGRIQAAGLTEDQLAIRIKNA